jgi:Na+/H+ antiporter NhaD/arsenite permease-like protein
MRLAFAVFLIIWVCAIVSMFIDNIPFTTTMIPVVVKLTKVLMPCGGGHRASSQR